MTCCGLSWCLVRSGGIWWSKVDGENFYCIMLIPGGQGNFQWPLVVRVNFTQLLEASIGVWWNLVCCETFLGSVMLSIGLWWDLLESVEIWCAVRPPNGLW